MAFFKFRNKGEDKKIAPNPPQSIESIRKRAKQRLIGAVVLVLLGVIGFPLLVDNQPRPIAVDIPIDIPDRNKVKPLEQTQAVASSPAQSSGPILPAPAPLVVPEKPAEKPASPTSNPKSEAKPEPKPEPKAIDKPTQAVPTPDSGAKAQALLDASPLPAVAANAPPKAAAAGPAPASAAAASAPGAEERYIVQFGAYADANKARETRLRVEATGLKTYAQMVETKEGKRYRVRAGPFATKAEADKAAEQIKKLDLPVAILTL